MCRYLFTIKQFYHYGARLKQYLQDPKLQSSTVAAMLPDQLYRQGIRVLVIDFDGVLAPHAAAKPLDSCVQWLAACQRCFGAEHVFILSNKPTLVRQQYFNNATSRVAPNMPQSMPRLITGNRKKPYPDGILTIMDLTKCKPSEVLVIDDRLATGILAAELAGSKAILITKPLIDLAANPVRETFFIILRYLERLFCKFF